ncbi:pseudouridine synthase [Sphingomonas aestuarii]
MSDPTSKPADGQRIAKLLARAGIASRREIERMIADGRIALNGVVLDTPATILTSLTGVTVDGQPVAAPAPTRLFAFHKPPGCLTTEYDPDGRKTIYDHLPSELPRVIPVGRLDMNTEGLLLLTTDGELKRQLELPATGVERSYRARAYGDVTQEQLEELMMGVEIEGMRYGPINANLERRTGANAWIELTLTEGKNREVRRVLEHLGLEVSRLIRTRYGPFMLDDLPVGQVTEIRAHDLIAFRKSLDLPADKRRELRAEPGIAVAKPRPAAAVEPEGNLRKNPRAPRPTPVRTDTAPPRQPRAAPNPADPKKPIGFGARQRARFKPREDRPADPSAEPFQRNARPGPVARAGARVRPRGEELETRRPARDERKPGARAERTDRRPPPRAIGRQQSGDHPDYDPRTARGDHRSPWEGPGRDKHPARTPDTDRPAKSYGAKPFARTDRAARPVGDDRPHRPDSHRSDSARPDSSRPERPTRGKGWAKPKPPGSRPGGPRKGGPRK